MKGKLAILPVLAAAAAAPSGASAAPPDRVPLPGETLTAPAGVYCDFPIEVDPVNVREKLIAFSDGRVRVTGAAIIRLTNLDNGRSIVVNSSGPGWLDRNTAEGPQLFFLSPVEAGGPGIYLIHGQVRFTRDDAGNIDSLSYIGQRSGNLCDAIA